MNLTWSYIYFAFLWSTAALPLEETLLDEYCDEFLCYNGGTCTRRHVNLRCLCTPEYTGLHCQIPKGDAIPKNGLPLCPSTSSSKCDLSSCVVDQDCPGNRSCCAAGCRSTLCVHLFCDKCEWSDWSECRPDTATCGFGGIQKRTRDPDCCKNYWERQQERSCDLGPCPGCKLGPWTSCTVTCGPGVQRRRRIYGQRNCDGSYEWRTCSGPPCPSSSRCYDESNYCANHGTTCRDIQYQGRKNVTLMGLTCQRWDSQTPHKHKYSSVGHHNYCRDPDMISAPWCYTMDPDHQWGYCFRDCNRTPCRDKMGLLCVYFLEKGACNPGNRLYHAAKINCCFSCRQSQKTPSA